MSDIKLLGITSIWKISFEMSGVTFFATVIKRESFMYSISVDTIPEGMYPCQVLDILTEDFTKITQVVWIEKDYISEADVFDIMSFLKSSIVGNYEAL